MTPTRHPAIGGALLLVGLGGSYEARADDCSIPADTSSPIIIDSDTTQPCKCIQSFCASGNTIQLETDVSCDNKALEDSCTIASSTSALRTIDTKDNSAAFTVRNGAVVTFHHIRLLCGESRATKSALRIEDGSVLFTQSQLDGTGCSSEEDSSAGELALIQNDKLDLVGTVTVALEDSYGVGPIVALAGEEATTGSAQITITDSVIMSASEQEVPSIWLDASNIGMELDMTRSALWSASESGTLMDLAGPVSVTVTNSFLWGGTAEPLFTLDGDAPTLSLTQVTAMGDDRHSVVVNGGEATVNKSVALGFVGTGLSGTTSSNNLWVGDLAAPAGWSVAATAEDAGISSRIDTDPFCFAGSASSDDVCIDDQIIWPIDGCSDLVLWVDSTYTGMRGMFGAVTLPEDLEGAPDWAAATGLTDAGTLDDDDSDGWPDMLDTYPQDTGNWRPSWYRMTEEGCESWQNTCQEMLSADGEWTPYSPSDGLPSECNQPGVDSGGDSSPEQDSSGDTAQSVDSGAADTATTTLVGTDCFGRETIRVTVASLFLPGLGFLLAARRARRRQTR